MIAKMKTENKLNSLPINEKQNNPLNYYYSRYNDYLAGDAEVSRNMDWHNPYDLMQDTTRVAYPQGETHHQHS